jgi:hypothetical protein
MLIARSSLSDCRTAELRGPSFSQPHHPFKELLLATAQGRVQLLLRCDSLLVLHGERFQFGLPGCFASRLPRGAQLVLAGVVVGPTTSAVAGLAVRLAPTRLARATPKSAFAVMTPQRGQALG